MFVQGKPITPEALTARLKADKAKGKVDVVIAGDKEVPLQKLLDVMDLVRAEDITSVGINDNRFSVLLATSGGAFPAVSEFHSVGAGSAPRALVSGNFTKDARPDVVVTTGTAGAVLFKHCP